MEEQFLEKDGVVIMVLKGHLSTENLAPVMTFLTQKINEKNYRFIFDLSEVSWMGSMALGILATAIREALAHNTRVRLVNPNQKIIGLLQETSLLELCHVYATREKALESFR
ncbi:MAG: STAS domain-containing protein [Brevinematales bacterium]|nr:STAS domain-containing protein [Brevinematales bacterium]